MFGVFVPKTGDGAGVGEIRVWNPVGDGMGIGDAFGLIRDWYSLYDPNTANINTASTTIPT